MLKAALHPRPEGILSAFYNLNGDVFENVYTYPPILPSQCDIEACVD